MNQYPENTLEAYAESFESAQKQFKGKLDITDHSGFVYSSTAQESQDFLTDNGEEAIDIAADNGDEDKKFFPVTIDTQYLCDDTSKLFVNRVLLMRNPILGALSPAIITEDPKQPGEFQITQLGQPYAADVGITDGIHFGVSLKAQTRAKGFGSHGEDGALEQGHFGGLIIAGDDERVASALIENGDKASHDILAGVSPETLAAADPAEQRKTGGIPETLAAKGMIKIPEPKTRRLPTDRPILLRAYWHHRLEGKDGPIGGDFPNATRLMLGAGIKAIGSAGLERAGLLVEDAIRGVS